jgi:hypothetical protein
VEDERLNAERGSGRFLERKPNPQERPADRLATELDPARNFGAELL